jgi:multidrug efflux pump subunit AcrA (membrane-fusion protein)
MVSSRLGLCLLLLIIIQMTSLTHAQEIKTEGTLLQLIDEVKVSATQAGRLASFPVREGDEVNPGDLVVEMEDIESKLMVQRATAELQLAKQKASNQIHLELARNYYELQKQILAEKNINLDISLKVSENKLPIQAREKSKDVANNELTRAVNSRKAFAGSVSESEIDKLQLSLDQAQLELEQAAFELEVEKLKADGQKELVVQQNLAVNKAKLDIDNAKEECIMDRLTLDLKQVDYEIASHALKEHRLVAPLAGVVVEKYKSVGTWVEKGEPILRIIRLDKLRAEAFIDHSYYSQALRTAKIMIRVDVPETGPVELPGVVSYIAPEVNPINGQIRIWVEFDNAERKVLPGMKGDLVIVLAK